MKLELIYWYEWLISRYCYQAVKVWSAIWHGSIRYHQWTIDRWKASHDIRSQIDNPTRYRSNTRVE